MSLEERKLLINARGGAVLSISDPDCKKCLESCSLNSEKVSACSKEGVHRKGMMERENIGIAYLCTSDANLVASSKIFKQRLSSYLETIFSINEIKLEVKKDEMDVRRRLIHNLSSLLAHMQQELYYIVPQQELSKCKSAPEQISLIREMIARGGKEAAQATLKIIKNVQAIKSELSVFQLLDSNVRRSITPKSHRVFPVLRNITSIFFQDFQENGIEVVTQDCTIELLFDYESVSVAFHHIFLNAVKYCLSNTRINIEFDQKQDKFCISITMTSLEIKPEEAEAIFEEKVSGSHAKAHSLAGTGVGLSIAKNLFELNGVSIYIEPGTDIRVRSGKRYATNKFFICFPNKLISKLKY